MQQLNIELEKHSATKYKAASIEVGECFNCFNKMHDYMRVKPTGFLLNSNVITDVLVRGDVLAVNLYTGVLRVFRGDEIVNPVKLGYREIK